MNKATYVAQVAQKAGRRMPALITQMRAGEREVAWVISRTRLRSDVMEVQLVARAVTPDQRQEHHEKRRTV